MLFSAAHLVGAREPPADRSPSNVPRARVRLTTHQSFGDCPCDPPARGRAGIERVGDRDCLSALASCCRALASSRSSFFALPPFTGPHSPGSFFGFTPSDRGQPPLTPLSRERRLAVPLAPRIVSARLASTRRASVIPGASVFELSSRGPRSQSPAIACLVAAFAVTILDHPPPRRGFAAAPRLLRSLSARSLRAFTRIVAQRPRSFVRSRASIQPSLRGESQLGCWRSVALRRLPSSSDPRARPTNRRAPLTSCLSFLVLSHRS